MLFCDTSTLAKYYVPEAESGAVCARLDAEDQVVLSELARAEDHGRLSPATTRAHVEPR